MDVTSSKEHYLSQTCVCGICGIVAWYSQNVWVLDVHVCTYLCVCMYIYIYSNNNDNNNNNNDTTTTNNTTITNHNNNNTDNNNCSLLAPLRAGRSSRSAPQKMTRGSPASGSQRVLLHMHVCIYLSIYVYIYIYIYTHIYIYIHINTHIMY